MSIPSTEFKPDRFRSQPQGQIRNYLRDADEQETQNFLETLRQRVAIKPLTFILQLALAVLFLVLGLAYELPLLLVLGALVIPAFNALTSMALASGISSVKTAGFALLAIVLMALALFGGGYLAHTLNLQQVSAIDLPFAFILNNTWLVWLVLLVAAALTAIWFTCNNAFGRISAIIFNLLVFAPFFLAGMQFAQGDSKSMLATLLIASLRLLAVVVFMMLVFWILRIKPKGSIGWALFSVLILLLGLLVYATAISKPIQPSDDGQNYNVVVVTPPTLEEVSLEPSPIPEPTPSPTPTQKALEPSPTSQPTNTPAPSPTPQPRQARVNAADGLYCRQGPGTNTIADFLNYNALLILLDEEEVRNDRTWQKVLTASDIECWVNVSYLEILNP